MWIQCTNSQKSSSKISNWTPPPKILSKVLSFPAAQHTISVYYPPYLAAVQLSSAVKITPMSTIVLLTILITFLYSFTTTTTTSLCRNYCNNIRINYPFAVDHGCGAPQFRDMLNCSTNGLFFLTPSGSYKVQTIDYNKNTILLFDPSMSTCSILQPHHDFLLTDTQSLLTPPSPDTLFALVNCSTDSPLLNHYRYLCANMSGHTCDELYSSCTSFKLFKLIYNATPPCCFTTYNTLKFMSMNVLDCTHYTSVYNVDALQGIGPLDWMYGIKLSYTLPDLGCERCVKSAGTCGFDVDTQAFICICSSTTNATRDCGIGMNAGMSYGAASWLGVYVSFIGAILSL